MHDHETPRCSAMIGALKERVFGWQHVQSIGPRIIQHWLYPGGEGVTGGRLDRNSFRLTSSHRYG